MFDEEMKDLNNYKIRVNNLRSYLWRRKKRSSNKRTAIKNRGTKFLE